MPGDIASGSGGLISGAGFSSGDVFQIGSLTCDTGDNITTTSNSFTLLDRGIGAVDVADIPSNNIRLRMVAQMLNSTSNESCTIRPKFKDTTTDTVTPTSLQVSITSTTTTEADSGWQNVTASLDSERLYIDGLEGKVSGGTGTFLMRRTAVLVGVQL
jgi:hypothetical protein